MRFQTFRRCFLGLIAAFSCLSVVLAARSLLNINQRKLFCMIISIQSASMLRSVWSATRKPVFKHVQRVSVEIVTLFLLLPFQLVLALVTSTSNLSHDVTEAASIALEISVLATCILNVGYTTCLLMAVIITSIVRDADIWTRNIDSYPSPFPIMPLLFFAFPCLSRASCPDESRKSEGPLCLPGCHCDTKLEHAEMTDGGLVPSTRSVGESLSRTLVRVPDAADRRAPIVIAFEVY